MRILISNDDGVAPGLSALHGVSGLRQCAVIARSGQKRREQFADPLIVLCTHHIAQRLYRLNGTPTDCVHWASMACYRT